MPQLDVLSLFHMVTLFSLAFLFLLFIFAFAFLIRTYKLLRLRFIIMKRLIKRSELLNKNVFRLEKAAYKVYHIEELNKI